MSDDETDALLNRANDDLMAQIAKAFNLPRSLLDGSAPSRRERFTITCSACGECIEMKCDEYGRIRRGEGQCGCSKTHWSADGSGCLTANSSDAASFLLDWRSTEPIVRSSADLTEMRNTVREVLWEAFGNDDRGEQFRFVSQNGCNNVARQIIKDLGFVSEFDHWIGKR